MYLWVWISSGIIFFFFVLSNNNCVFCLSEEHGQIVNISRCRVRSSRFSEIPPMQRRRMRLAVPVAQKPVDEHLFQNETVGKRTGIEKTEIGEKVKESIVLIFNRILWNVLLVSSGGRKRCHLPLGFFSVSLKTTINTRIKNSKSLKKPKKKKNKTHKKNTYLTIYKVFQI